MRDELDCSVVRVLLIDQQSQNKYDEMRKRKREKLLPEYSGAKKRMKEAKRARGEKKKII